jgi:hypothetical protein
MEQRYFEQRAMLGGMAPGAGLFDGYRKGEREVLLCGRWLIAWTDVSVGKLMRCWARHFLPG